MENLETGQGLTLENITPEERTLLLRYCLRVTTDLHLAEDLVQQTLLEAWQHANRLTTPEGRAAWLRGVARNVCLRWLRSEGREAAHRVRPAGEEDPVESLAAAAPGEAGDPLAEIERQDLADLLGQALALLPPATRDALVGRYIEDLSQAALADRLGVSEGAVEARLQRGKQALRTLLTTRFREQLAAYGLGAPAHDGWETTRIWCPNCGQHRLVAQFPVAPGSVEFRCPGCDPDPAIPKSRYPLANVGFSQLIGSLSQPRAVLNRTARWLHPYFMQGLEAGWVPCSNCGQRAYLQIESEPKFVSARNDLKRYRLLVICPACGEVVSITSTGLVETLPAVQRFWQQHERIRTLPSYEVERGGQLAVVTSFESVTTAARLAVVVTRDPFRLVYVEGAPATQEDR